MKCPNCNEDMPSRQCPDCDEEIPVFGKFCCYCGSGLEDLNAEEPDQNTGTMDFSERTLCSDGTCIGVINERGVCNECAKPYKGKAE